MKAVLTSDGIWKLTLGAVLIGARAMAAGPPDFVQIDYPQAASTHAFSINSRGQVVGFYTDAGQDHGYLLSGGSYTSIDFPGAIATYAYSINAHQETVGSYIAGGVTHGFLLRDGKMTQVDYPGSASTEVLGINDAGDIVGDYSVSSQTPCCAAGTHAFVASGGKFTSFDFPGSGVAFTWANAIDPNGVIVGAYSDGKSRGFQMEGGKLTSIEYPTPSTIFMNTLGINARGDIVGRYQDADGRHAYLLSGGQYTNIDIPGAFLSAATAIDSAGNILGQYRDFAANNFHGFLLRAGGPRYSITDLGPQGATGGPFTLLDTGVISGSVPVSSGAVHAVLWYDGVGPADIGASSADGLNGIAYGVNDQWQVAGAVETSSANSADFCGFVGAGVSEGKACVPFVWQNGTATVLPTLGGPNGYATAINARGDVGGLAETATVDSHSCPSNQFKPVVWQKGVPGQLATEGVDVHGNNFKDPNGFVYWINDAGQSVGASGDCSPGASPNGTLLQPLHALLWESNGAVHDLGSLGGTGRGTGIWAVHINSHGSVVGSSDLRGDEFAHAFRWTKQTGIQDLGTLPGDQQSGAIWTSDAGDVVGVSISFDGGFNPRAFVLRNGATEMIDLNGTIPASSPFYLLFAVGINSRQEIIATAFNSSDNQVHSVLLSPTGSRFAHTDGAIEALGAVKPPALPGSVRRMIARKYGNLPR